MVEMIRESMTKKGMVDAGEVSDCAIKGNLP